MDLQTLPETRNQDLALLYRPKRLTLAEFEALEVSDNELQTRIGIYALEEHLHTRPEAKVDRDTEQMGMVPVHRFSEGLYCRELYIPPDVIVVGKRHAVEHLVMLTTGRCVCITERGKQEMVAPMTFISPAGEKRVVMTYPDEGCTWVTVHPTKETTRDAVEQDVIIQEPARDQHYRLVREASLKELEMSEVKS